jgi:hypothetical protein
MTKRERILAGAVLTPIILGGLGFLFNLFFLDPLASRRRTIDTLHTDITRKQERIKQVAAEKPRLERWKEQSLPGDTDTELYAATRSMYSRYLRTLMDESGLGDARITPGKPDTRTSPVLAGKKPLYTRLTFTVEQARGNLDSVVAFLESFYHTGMLHQIKELRVARPRTRTADQKPDDLDVHMTIEALVVNGAEPRPYLPFVDRRLLAIDTMNNLRGGPFGLGMALQTAGPAGPYAPPPLAPRRDYEDIVAKNAFFPKEEAARDDVEVTQYVYLTDITHNDQYAKGHENEALFYNRLDGSSQHLRAARGFDRLSVRDGRREEVVSGTVVRLGDRDVYFTSEGKYYVWHVGQNLDETLRNPLSDYKVKELKELIEKEKPSGGPGPRPAIRSGAERDAGRDGPG